MEAWSYNSIYQFAKEHYKSNKIICIPTVHFTTINVEIPEVNLDDIICRIISNPVHLEKIPWQTFEEIIARLFQREGYDVLQTPLTRDGGVDLILNRSGIVEDNCVVQCKHYSKPKLGIRDIYDLYGSVLASQSTKGIIVTSGDVTKLAREFAEGKRYTIQVIDRTNLLQWMSRSLAKR